MQSCRSDAERCPSQPARRGGRHGYMASLDRDPLHILRMCLHRHRRGKNDQGLVRRDPLRMERGPCLKAHEAGSTNHAHAGSPRYCSRFFDDSGHLILIGPYASTTVHFGVKVNDFGTGAMLGIAALVFAVIFFLRRAGSCHRGDVGCGHRCRCGQDRGIRSSTIEAVYPRRSASFADALSHR